MCSNAHDYTRRLRRLLTLPPCPQLWTRWMQCCLQVRQWPQRCSLAGAPSMPAIVAMSSSRLGILDTAVTPARSRRVLAHSTTKDHEVIVILGRSPRQPWQLPQGPRKRLERSCPSDKSAMLAHGFPSRAILASLFFATRTASTCIRRARAQVLHVSNCQTGVVGLPQQRQSFRRFGRVRRPIVSFWALSTVLTPVVGGAQPLRLVFTAPTRCGNRVLSGSSQPFAWNTPGRNVSSRLRQGL